MKNKIISKGEADYDHEYDILSFKASDQEYSQSVELDNIVIDLNKQKQIIGIQIFDASKLLKLNKDTLLNIPEWEFRATINDGKIEIRLTFQVIIRNKIVEKNPIIMQSLSDSLPNSEMLCQA